MKLEEYIKKHSLAVSEFAVLIGAKSRATVHRYMNGSGRVPSPEMMTKIAEATGGAVTANDFYNLPKPKKTRRNL